MKTRNVKRNIEDYTLSVPLSVLPGLNADYVSAKSAYMVTCRKQLCERLTSGVRFILLNRANGKSYISRNVEYAF